jgi:hypothetical protein
MRGGGGVVVGTQITPARSDMQKSRGGIQPQLEPVKGSARFGIRRCCLPLPVQVQGNGVRIPRSGCNVPSEYMLTVLIC